MEALWTNSLKIRGKLLFKNICDAFTMCPGLQSTDVFQVIASLPPKTESSDDRKYVFASQATMCLASQFFDRVPDGRAARGSSPN